MTFAEKNATGVFTGSTAVDVVPVPASAHTSVIRNVSVFNADTVAHTFTLIFNDNASLRNLPPFVLDAGAGADYDTVQVLDATTKKLQAKIEGAHTTTAPTFVANWGDVS
jgi:hypothetical protein